MKKVSTAERLHQRLRNAKGYQGKCEVKTRHHYERGTATYFCELHWWPPAGHRNTTGEPCETAEKAEETAFKELENMLVNAEIKEERQELKRYAALQTTNHRYKKTG